MEGPDGEAANKARNCFLTVATPFASLSIVRLWVCAPPSLHEVHRYRGVEPVGGCGSGAPIVCTDPIATVFWAGLVYVAPSICPLRPAGFVEAVSVAPGKPGFLA